MGRDVHETGKEEGGKNNTKTIFSEVLEFKIKKLFSLTILNLGYIKTFFSGIFEIKCYINLIFSGIIEIRVINLFLGFLKSAI